MTTLNSNDHQGQNIYDANRPKFQRSFLHPRYWGVWGLIVLSGLLSLLPYKVMRWLGTLIGKLFATANFKVVRMRRQVARININHAFKSYSAERREQLFQDYCKNVGHSLFDVIIAWYWPKWRFKRLIKLPNQDFSAYYEKVHFLFLCPHFHNLESTARAIGLILPSYGVYLPNQNPVWDWFQYHMRLRNNKALVARHNMRQMIQTLALKQGLFYAPDQNLGPKSSIHVPFFEVDEVCTTTGTYMLYRKFPDLTLVPCMLVPSSDPHYAYEFKILEPLTFPAQASDRDVVIATNQAIEKMVLLDISNYMWMHKRFKHRRDGQDFYADVVNIKHSHER